MLESKTIILREGERVSNERMWELADEGWEIVRAWDLGPLSQFGPHGTNLVLERMIYDA